VIKKLKQIAREENKIVILSAHDIHLCLKYVDAVFLIHQKDWAYNDKNKITSSEVFENFLNTEE
jgi:ABC-type Mn2+/Zn2+ transport system ATPase subunit